VPSIHSTYLQRLASPWARGCCTEYYAAPIQVVVVTSNTGLHFVESIMR
jgi:hypothetical protein